MAFWDTLDLFRSLAEKFLSLEDLAHYDSACCNKERRETMMLHFRQKMSVPQCISTIPCCICFYMVPSDDEVFQYAKARGLTVSHLYLKDRHLDYLITNHEVAVRHSLILDVVCDSKIKFLRVEARTDDRMFSWFEFCDMYRMFENLQTLEVVVVSISERNDLRSLSQQFSKYMSMISIIDKECDKLKVLKLVDYNPNGIRMYPDRTSTSHSDAHIPLEPGFDHDAIAVLDVGLKSIIKKNAALHSIDIFVVDIRDLLAFVLSHARDNQLTQLVMCSRSQQTPTENDKNLISKLLSNQEKLNVLRLGDYPVSSQWRAKDKPSFVTWSRKNTPPNNSPEIEIRVGHFNFGILTRQDINECLLMYPVTSLSLLHNPHPFTDNDMFCTMAQTCANSLQYLIIDNDNEAKHYTQKGIRSILRRCVVLKHLQLSACHKSLINSDFHQLFVVEPKPASPFFRYLKIRNHLSLETETAARIFLANRALSTNQLMWNFSKCECVDIAMVCAFVQQGFIVDRQYDDDGEELHCDPLPMSDRDMIRLYGNDNDDDDFNGEQRKVICRCKLRSCLCQCKFSF